MTTPSLAERVRHGLDALLHRPHDLEREREWAQRSSEVDYERRESAETPVPGMRGSQPYDFGHKKGH